MWYLNSDTDKRKLYVVPNKDITIGRSGDAQVCNFAIPEDASISRKHALLSVIDNALYIQDLGSRYGTFVNDFAERIGSTLRIKLKKGETVRFGKINSVWKVHECNLVTCTSTLKGENLQNLKQCLNALGGVLKSDWDDSCMYLTMPAITLTVKVVLALAQGAYIVTTDFWKKCKEAVESHAPLPDPKDFVPQVVESTLNKENVSFQPNEERKQLFAGKTIVFFSKRQLDMYSAALLKCSASPVLLSDSKMTKAALSQEDTIVIQYNSTNTSQQTEAQRNQINDIVSYLKKKGKRVVADAEIGLAILYCSTDKNCNPEFNFSSEVIRQAPASTVSSNVLAQESQEPTQKLHKDNVIINESLTPTNSKRKFDEEEEMKTNKKFASEKLSIAKTTTNDMKRKFSDDSIDENPSKKMAVDNDDDMFNFMNNATEKNSSNTDNQLNFTKPSQKKQNSANDEDDLFNFVQDKNKEDDSVKNKNASENIVSSHGQKRKLEDEKVDIAALRGIKLKELAANQTNWSSENYSNIKIKKEDPDDLDQKMNELDLGTTILTIRKNLIVKKEPTTVEQNESVSNQKNFKKFKKVWPVKMQVTVIPKTTMSIQISDMLAEEITSQSY